MLLTDKTHRVQKVVFQLATSSFNAAKQVEEEATLLCSEELERILEEVFDTYDRGDRVIRIECIELNPGRLNIHGFREELREALYKGLKEFFEENLTELSGYSEDYPLTYGLPAEMDENIRLHSSALHLVEQLEEFLSTGTLPWNADERVFRDMDTLITGLMEEYPERVERLIKRALSTEGTLKRLVFNLKEESLKKILSLYSGVSPHELEEIIDAIDRVYETFKKHRLKEERESFVYTALLKKPALYRRQDKEGLLMLWLEDSLKERLKGFTEEELAEFTREYKALAIRKPENKVYKYMEEYIENIKKQMPESETSLDTAHGIPLTAEEFDRKEPHPASPDEASFSEHIDAEKEQWFVSNSGLVLLWPYLEKYFERLGLVKDEKFRSEECRVQAVAELEYLVRGDSDYMEYHLVLCKVLCGVKLTTPVEPGYRREPMDGKEADSLLRHAIENWKKIGKTSVDGFRRAFLMREGKLTRAGAGWNLLVERKAYDVLLDYLPYPPGVVKLPWMKEALYTEW